MPNTPLKVELYKSVQESVIFHIIFYSIRFAIAIPLVNYLFKTETATENRDKLSQRKSVSGRPLGTDGSDFSYRMVVDSRYQKVAEGKSRLLALILTQALVRILEAATLLLPTPKGETVDRLYAASNIICFISLFIGEIGRKRSRSSFLKLYLFGSSIAAVTSVAFLFKSEKLFELIEDFSKWEISMAKMFKVAAVLLEVIVQIVTIGVTSSLMRNMAPPKRAS